MTSIILLDHYLLVLIACSRQILYECSISNLTAFCQFETEDLQVHPWITLNEPKQRQSHALTLVASASMSTTSMSRPKTPVRTRSHSRNPSLSTAHADDPQNINFGTASELTGIRTPPTAKAIPLQTPSYSLAGRTKESLRLARERQLESVKKQPAAARKTNVPPGTTQRAGATVLSSVSRSRVTTTSSFNPARIRPITPVSTFRSTTPVTPSSPSRHSRQTSSVSATSSPKTPTSIKTTPVGPSTSVREAIAKAKQAHKAKAAQKTPSMRAKRIDYSNDTSFDEIENPFNLTPGTPPLVVQLRRAIEAGRTTGSLPSS
jgi:hypothetical protein